MTGTYEVALVVTGVERMSNVSPPTLLLALHCTWMSCAFVAAAGPIRRWADRPRVWRVVAVGNGGAMTLYLWHIPAIAVAAFSLHAVGLDAYAVHGTELLGPPRAAGAGVRDRHGRRRSGCSHRSSTARCHGGTRRPAPPVSDRPLPVR